MVRRFMAKSEETRILSLLSGYPAKVPFWLKLLGWADQQIELQFLKGEQMSEIKLNVGDALGRTQYEILPGVSSADAINEMCKQVHKANERWWLDLTRPIPHQPSGTVMGYSPAERNVGEMLCLVHSEISEALEGHRKNLQDDKLPHRKQIEVELADAIIRIFDIAQGLGLDLGGAYEEKMAYNAKREDHKIENRLKEGGKKY